MATYTYPGVYIEELPSGVHAITGVATSIAAFVGWAPKGPTNAAVLVQSWTDYSNQFGGLDTRSYLGYSVNQFFANGGQQAYIVRLAASAAPASVTITDLEFDPTVSPSKVTLATGANAGLTLTAVNSGIWGDNYSVQISPKPDSTYKRFSLAVQYTDPVTKATSTVESYANLSLDPNDSQGRYAVSILNEQSNVLNASMNATTPLTVKVDNTVPATLPVSGFGSEPLGSGSDGTVLAPTTTAGTPGGFETALNATGTSTGGLQLLATVTFNLLCVPGEMDPATISNLQAFCFAQRAFFIIDSASTDTFTSLQNGPNTSIIGNNAINSALYFPWVNAFDPLGNATRAFPPCGFVAGVYASTDSSRGVWKAPAGIDAGLTGESGLAVTLTDLQNGTLNQQGINCLRNFRSYGDVVWGARTLRGADAVGSEWKYVPIRRLALYLESSLYEGTQWVVFEPNDATLWGQIRLNVGAFMQNLFLQGAFQGTTPSQAYFVKCDAENNPQSSIDVGVVNVLVGFAPLYPAEFVVIQIQQSAGQSQ